MENGKFSKTCTSNMKMKHPYHHFDTGNYLIDESLEKYIMHGYEPGGFLTAVLANDLFLAVGRADHWNKDRLPRIVNEVVHTLPDLAFGDYQAVRDWCADKDGRRSHYVEYKEQQRVWDIMSGELDEKVSNEPPF